MALKRGYVEDSRVEGSRSKRGPRYFWLPGGTETTVVLLDDDPIRVVRHRYYIAGDREANDLRQTCAGMDPDTDKAPVPRLCLCCNTMLRHKTMDRGTFFYYSLIDERKYEHKGQDYKDQRNLLELSPAEADVFAQRKKARGRLAGSRFRVYRGKDKQAKRIGSDWEFLEVVDLRRHFWYSPAIPKTMEAQRKRDPKSCPPTQAAHHLKVVEELIAPFDYEALMGKYIPAEAEAFCSLVLGTGDGAAAPQAADRGAASGGGSYSAPPPPESTTPDYAMSPGSVPTSPQAPAAQPSHPTPPPPVADPARATAAQAPYAPPPPPAAAPAAPPPAAGLPWEAPAATGAPPPPPASQSPAAATTQPTVHSGYAPPPVPAASAPPAGGRPHDAYSFGASAGWSQAVPGMAPSAPSPAAAARDSAMEP